MKSKTLLTLLGGMLTTSFAMASSPDFTLVTSDNLIDKYSVYDSGLYSSSGSTWLGTTNYMQTTNANALGAAYKNDMGQWYQTTEFVTTTSYDYSYQNFTQSRRNVYLWTSEQVTDSFIDLTVNTSSPMSYSVDAYGVNGSTTTPRGFTQVVAPSLGLFVDGVQVATNTQSYTYANPMGPLPPSEFPTLASLSDANTTSSTWYGDQNGTVSNSFQAVAEAADGSYITSLNMSLTGDKVLEAIATQNYSYVSQRLIQDVAISAPVPEPETYAMMLAGLGLLGAVARRRKQRQA